MVDRSIAAYAFTVTETGPDKTACTLDNFNKAGADVLVYVRDFCRELVSTHLHAEKEQKYLRGRTVDTQERTVQTKIESGDYGYASHLFNIRSETIVYQRTVEDAELLALRNLFIAPLGSTRGLFLTERVGNHGLKSIFSSELIRAFRDHFDGYSLSINPLIPTDAVAQTIRDGKLGKIRLIKHGIPSDFAKKYQLDQHEDDTGTLELWVNPRGRFKIPQRLSKMIQGKDRLTLLEVGGIQYDEMKLEVDITPKRRRSISITENWQLPRVTFPMPDEYGSVAPNDSDVYGFALGVARDLAENIGLRLNSRRDKEFTWPSKARTHYLGDSQ